jgi:hypothetical protein
LWNFVYVLGLILSALFVLASIAEGRLRDLYFTSDILYIPTLFADLTRWYGKFDAWNLTPAPYLFPDALLYGFTAFVTPRLETAQYLAGYLQLLLILVSARELVRRALPDRAEASKLVVPLLVGWLMLFHFGGEFVVGPLLAISYHGGALLGALAVFTLCLRPRAKPRALGAFVVAILSALTGASDGMFVVGCAAVLGLSGLTSALARLGTRKSERQPSVLLPVRCALAAVFGVGAMIIATAAGLAQGRSTEANLTIAVENATRLWNHGNPIGRYVVVGLGVVAIFAVVVIVATRKSKRLAGLRTLAWWQILMTPAILSAVFHIGGYVDGYSVRYFVIPIHFGVIFVCALVIDRIGQDRAGVSARRSPLAWSVVLTLALAVGLATNVARLMSAPLAAPHRKTADCLQRVAAREEVRIVVSDYWRAKPLMLFTDDRAHVIEVTHRMEPRFWINSRGWYRSPGEFGIVIVNGQEPQLIWKILGRPQVVEFCDNLELYIYRGNGKANMSRRLHAIFERVLGATEIKPAITPLVAHP